MALLLPRPAGMSTLRFSIFLITTIILLLLLFVRVQDPKGTYVVKSGSEKVSTAIGSYEVDSEKPLVEFTEPLENFAFATFLNAPYVELEADDDDRYFIMARMMAFQLLHNPETKTQRNYPFVVFTSEGVRQSKIERLRKDGATVISIERITSDWLKTKNSQWWDQLTKLRLWQFIEYDKIAYFDTDTMIVSNMDGIFTDVTTEPAVNLGNPEQAPDDEGPQPTEYMFAAAVGRGGYDHIYPPSPRGKSLNAGCFVLTPSEDVFNYYMRVLSIPNRFPMKYMEQALLAYVHRPEGNMPWRHLTWTWNANWAIFNDTTHGVASLHQKYWTTDHDMKLKELAYELKGKALGFFMAQSSNSDTT